MLCVSVKKQTLDGKNSTRGREVVGDMVVNLNKMPAAEKNTKEPVKISVKRHRWYLGGIASSMAACCTHPLDLIKVCNFVLSLFSSERFIHVPATLQKS